MHQHSFAHLVEERNNITEWWKRWPHVRDPIDAEERYSNEVESVAVEIRAARQRTRDVPSILNHLHY